MSSNDETSTISSVDTVIPSSSSSSITTTTTTAPTSSDRPYSSSSSTRRAASPAHEKNVEAKNHPSESTKMHSSSSFEFEHKDSIASYNHRPISPNISPKDNRITNDFGNYRRELLGSALESSGGTLPLIQHTSPTTSPIAPWMSNNYYNNDPNDNLPQASPGIRPSTARAGTLSSDSPDHIGGYYNDERRPSLASIMTASSSGSKSSVSRAGGYMHKKLQGFFGDDFPGKEGADTPALPGKHEAGNQKVHRAPSYSRQRERTNSTKETPNRDQSPAAGGSRPATPVPSSEVVPFLYQDSQDISKYGEAPVRENLFGPDKERYTSDIAPQVPPKPSSRSVHAGKVPKPGPNHRQQRSAEDSSRTPRAGSSREESSVNSTRQRERAGVPMTYTKPSTQRSVSPTPSSWSQNTVQNNAFDGPSSPQHPTTKRRFLDRILRSKDKDEAPVAQLRNMPGSVISLQAPGKSDSYRSDGSPGPVRMTREPSLGNSDQGFSSDNKDNKDPRPNNGRQATFTKLPFRKQKGSKPSEDYAGIADLTERNDSVIGGKVFDLDTNMDDMEGILAHPPPLTPLDSSMFNLVNNDEQKPDSEGPIDGWAAPDSWAVKKPILEESLSTDSDLPTVSSSVTYSIRIFKTDGSYLTLSIPLTVTVTEVMSQVGRKLYLPADTLENYQMIMKKHDLQQVLGPGDRPVALQKRLLQQAGYDEERDRLEDVGREDNSYLCRFIFGPALTTSGFGIERLTKFSHIELSGKNLIAIPISLYSKASEIISLNVSRNLSLEIPTDFIQSCLNLRNITFANNEARGLPQSLRKASRLAVLDLSNNRLEEQGLANTSSLKTLIKLKLANNRLGDLPPYFGQFNQLRDLDVSSNFLEVFPEFLCDLSSLVTLDMSFNAISSLPDKISNLVSLNRFAITNNRLAGTLPQSFSQLSALKEVDIRYNALSNIHVISQLPKVEVISADHNAISVFEGEFEKIRILRLNSNPVTKFEIQNSVPTLTQLILSNAKLATLADACFDKMPNLVKLVLDKNHFVSLPNHIGKLRKLEYFSIARNALSSLPPEIGCLTELRFFDVRENNLKKLPPEIWWASKLETFNISSNVLENFPKPQSRPPQVPGDVSTPPNPPTGTPAAVSSLSRTASSEDIGPLEGFNQRRPSQASGGLLSVGSSPVPGANDRNTSVVSLYGRGGRNTSVISRTASDKSLVAGAANVRRDSGLSSKLANTFAASLKNLYLADNQLDDDVFDEIAPLGELRILNLSYNELNDIPLRSMKSWPNLVELYLSGNELTSLPTDDFGDNMMLQVLHINGNKFQTLPAELGRAHRLTVLDCGSNSLKYNLSNYPYDWNWNYNVKLKFLNLSGNKRLEIKPSPHGLGHGGRDGKDQTDFAILNDLRILGLMDVTLIAPTIPDQTEDRRVRTSGSLAGSMAYGMADTLGKNDHLSIIDMVVPRFNSAEAETLLGMFDGEALTTGGSKIAKYLHENFGHIFGDELKRLNVAGGETPSDALRRAFLSLNKDLATAAMYHTQDRPLHSHRGSAATAVLSQADSHSGGVATVLFLQKSELFVANVGDAQAMLIHSEGGHRMLTRKHDPAEPNERQRIRDAGGWVSRQGKLNDVLHVSRAFGYVQLMPAVQAAPHISRVTIKESDEMILIASRELWEYLSPELVVDIARSERRDLMRASQRLRDLAMAFGASGKIMVMMIGVSDLKKRERLSRLNRGVSISMGPSGILDESYATRRVKKGKGDAVDDQMLRRLQAEVTAPTGEIAMVFTDIKSSTLLWEQSEGAMRSAIKLHNEVMRRQLRIIGGYEVKTEGDAFMVSFPTATSALLWCFSVQTQLLEVEWPQEVLDSIVGKEVMDLDNNVIFRGLSVRMGIHWGSPVCERDPITRRMDYFGPMVNRSARIMGEADGGQITVSADFITEIQRCLETYNEGDRSSSNASDDLLDNDAMIASIRKELRSLSSQGFEVKDMGEKKLKGLENPEILYLMYPHSLSGRMHYHENQNETARNAARAQGLEEPATLSPDSELSINPECVWVLWKLSLRLEQLCSFLEDPELTALRTPETAILERMKNKAGVLSDTFMVNFMTHLISRIEACANTLAIRHLSIGSGPILDLRALSHPMADIFKNLADEQSELERYKATFGPLPPISDTTSAATATAATRPGAKRESVRSLGLTLPSQDAKERGFRGLPNLPSPGPSLLEGLSLLGQQQGAAAKAAQRE